MTKPENIAKMVLTLFKFVVVIWLIFYNGWQQGVYRKIVDFTTASYSFVGNMFVKSVKNARNNILNFPSSSQQRALKVVMVDNLTREEKDILLCYRRGLLGEISYAVLGFDNTCPAGYQLRYLINSDLGEAVKIYVTNAIDAPSKYPYNLTLTNNQEISQLLYFIDKYNKENPDKLQLKIQVTNNFWSNILADGGLWSSDYDGCYFDVTEYEEDKGYLALFDTFDCKMIRYLGYSTDSLAPNLILYSVFMLAPNLVFGQHNIVSRVFNSIGSLLFGLMMSFMFIIFNLLIKAVYLFLSSFFTLSILIFVSPIVLPLMFFEKTKKIFDNWLESLASTIFKPILSFGFSVVYVNLMDIILLKGVFFDGHSNIGRGARLACPDGVFSFICLINGLPIIQQVTQLIELFNSSLINIFFDVITIVVFFILSDKIMEDVENIAQSIFKNFMGGTGSSTQFSMLKSGYFGGQGVESSLKMAMGAGEKLEQFRHDYITNAPGTLLDKVARAKTSSPAGSGIIKRGIHGGINAIPSAAAGIQNLQERVGDYLSNKRATLQHNTARFFKAKKEALIQGVQSVTDGYKARKAQMKALKAAERIGELRDSKSVFAKRRLRQAERKYREQLGKLKELSEHKFNPLDQEKFANSLLKQLDKRKQQVEKQYEKLSGLSSEKQKKELLRKKSDIENLERFVKGFKKSEKAFQEAEQRRLKLMARRQKEIEKEKEQPVIPFPKAEPPQPPILLPEPTMDLDTRRNELQDGLAKLQKKAHIERIANDYKISFTRDENQQANRSFEQLKTKLKTELKNAGAGEDLLLLADSLRSSAKNANRWMAQELKKQQGFKKRLSEKNSTVDQLEQQQKKLEEIGQERKKAIIFRNDVAKMFQNKMKEKMPLSLLQEEDWALFGLKAEGVLPSEQDATVIAEEVSVSIPPIDDASIVDEGYYADDAEEEKDYFSENMSEFLEKPDSGDIAKITERDKKRQEMELRMIELNKKLKEYEEDENDADDDDDEDNKDNEDDD
jgi:type IV secretory pathway VirB6-like protein